MLPACLLDYFEPEFCLFTCDLFVPTLDTISTACPVITNKKSGNSTLVETHPILEICLELSPSLLRATITLFFFGDSSAPLVIIVYSP